MNYATVRKVAATFSARFHMDLDDVLSEAHELSLKVDEPGFLYRRLQDWRDRVRRANRLTRIQEADDSTLSKVPDRDTFSPSRLLVELSDDAAKVVRLSLRAHDHSRRETGGHGCTHSFAVEVLRELGWTFARVAESYGEIREALLG